jgi:hypothetical protein
MLVAVRDIVKSPFVSFSFHIFQNVRQTDKNLFIARLIVTAR